MAAKGELTSAPLSEVMLAMDVVDTLRHRQDLVVRELDSANRKTQLLERLRAIYLDQGIEVPDHILLEGVAALEQDRFLYTPASSGPGRLLAQIYASRSHWSKWVFGTGIALMLTIGAYFFAYLPYKSNVAEAARIELSQEMPAQMRTLYQSIFNETKVQTAAVTARDLLSYGQTAAEEGNRVQARQAIDQLTKIHDTLRLQYTLRVVNKEGIQSGFWTFPDINRSATNYYIVVEALNKNGEALELPIENEETGIVEMVKLWGLRVPEVVYNSIGADKRDDGIIQRNIIGQKEFGFLDIKYSIPVSGGAVTRW